MSRLEIEWPDEGAERVRAAQNRLAVAGEALRALPLEDRLARVAQVLGDWTAPDSPWRRELAASLSDATAFSAGTITEGLDRALRAWDPERFVQCARSELADVLKGGARSLAPFASTTVLAGGSIPMPTLLSGLLPLVVGSPVLLRETSQDPITPRLLARSLAARDHTLARCFEPIDFPKTDAAAFEAALAAPCVVATGSDETIASIARRLDPRTRFVGYGHRFSIAVVGTGLERDPESRRRAAFGIALDVARWDQSGCLSPVAVYLVGLPKSVASAFAGEILSALDRLEESMPRGDVDDRAGADIANERAEARMRMASSGAELFEGAKHTIVLETEARPRPAPLHRFLRLHPVESLEALHAALSPFAGHLSNVALAGFDGPPEARAADAGRSDPKQTCDTEHSVIAALSPLGVSRFAHPGHLQTPPVDWPHDGRPLFTPLARFVGSRA